MTHNHVQNVTKSMNESLLRRRTVFLYILAWWQLKTTPWSPCNSFSLLQQKDNANSEEWQRQRIGENFGKSRRTLGIISEKCQKNGRRKGLFESTYNCYYGTDNNHCGRTRQQISEHFVINWREVNWQKSYFDEPRCWWLSALKSKALVRCWLGCGSPSGIWVLPNDIWFRRVAPKN